MAHHVTITELRNMQVPDLNREVTGKRMSIAKMRLGLKMRSEKDSAMYRREKRELSRMLTVLGEKEKGGETALKPKSKSRKVAAPRSK